MHVKNMRQAPRTDSRIIKRRWSIGSTLPVFQPQSQSSSVG